MKGKEVIDWIKQYGMEDKDLRVEIPKEKPSGAYECFHCLHHSVIWDSDFMFEDCGYEGYGIVQFCHCVTCGAEIEYRIPLDDEEEEDGAERSEDCADVE